MKMDENRLRFEVFDVLFLLLVFRRPSVAGRNRTEVSRPGSDRRSWSRMMKRQWKENV